MALALCASLLLQTQCTTAQKANQTPKPFLLKPDSYDSLPGWKNADPAGAIAALEKSCPRIMAGNPNDLVSQTPAFGTYGQWQHVCQAMPPADEVAADDARRFFETHLTPALIKDKKSCEGLFTGYYEPLLNGALFQYGPFQYPLYKRPKDMVTANLGDFKEEWKGKRLVGQIDGQRLSPYPDREAIDEKGLENADILVWVDDPIDAFFLHIQGSGQVKLDDGRMMRVGYDGQNGHPYYAIGRELIKRGALTKENVSLQSIKWWLIQNPDEAKDLLHKNPSYIFFRALEEDGPIGAEGVTLTTGRSLAVDDEMLPYGLPLWVDIEAIDPKAGKLQRLMVAQDTGGAITGAVRGDVFWGASPRAEMLAGTMKSKGRYWALVPRSSVASE